MPTHLGLRLTLTRTTACTVVTLRVSCYTLESVVLELGTNQARIKSLLSKYGTLFG